MTVTFSVYGPNDNTGDPVIIIGPKDLTFRTDLASTASDKGGALVGFKQTGTGAVDLTMLAKARKVVSVTDFGAVGDGVTNDSAAVAAAFLAHTKIEFPAGTYLIENISVREGTKVFSRQGAVIKLKAQGTGSYVPIFELTGDDVSFEGLIFDGNRASQFANGWSDSFDGGTGGLGRRNRAAIVADDTYSGLTVTNCEFYEFYAASIATRDVSNISISNCQFHDSYLEGCFLQATSSATNARVVNCGFWNLYTDTSVDANCVAINHFSRVVVSNCTGYNFGRNLVKLEVCTDAVVDGNTINTNRTDAFNCLQAQSDGTNITFSNNVIRGTKAGIYINSGTFTNINILNNTLCDVTSTGTADGIQIGATVTNLTIRGNVLRNVKRYGVYLTGSIKNPTVSGNVIQADSNDGNLAMLFDTGSGFDHGVVSITGNTMTGKQSANDGIFKIGGTGTITALIMTSNTLIGAGAANNRAFWSTSAITVTSGVVAHNITSPGLAFYLLADSSSSVSFLANHGAVCTYRGAAVGIGARAIPTATAAPTTGTWARGDRVDNSEPSAGGVPGWVCTTGGTPGTWKAMAVLAA